MDIYIYLISVFCWWLIYIASFKFRSLYVRIRKILQCMNCILNKQNFINVTNINTFLHGMNGWVNRIVETRRYKCFGRLLVHYL
jgi:hypothetical protein